MFMFTTLRAAEFLPACKSLNYTQVLQLFIWCILVKRFEILCWNIIQWRVFEIPAFEYLLLSFPIRIQTVQGQSLLATLFTILTTLKYLLLGIAGCCVAQRFKTSRVIWKRGTLKRCLKYLGNCFSLQKWLCNPFSLLNIHCKHEMPV